MHYEETIKLLEIIKSLDSDFIETLPMYTSTHSNKKFSYQKKDNTIIFDMKITVLDPSTPLNQSMGQHIHNPLNIQAPSMTLSPGSVQIHTGTGNISVASYNTYNSIDDLSNNIKIIINADDFSLLSINWYIMKNNYVYALSSNHITSDEDKYGKQIMTALYINNNKAIIDGVLYSPDENANAFVEDINSTGISKLQILDLRDKYNE